VGGRAAFQTALHVSSARLPLHAWPAGNASRPMTPSYNIALREARHQSVTTDSLKPAVSKTLFSDAPLQLPTVASLAAASAAALAAAVAVPPITPAALPRTSTSGQGQGYTQYYGGAPSEQQQQQQPSPPYQHQHLARQKSSLSRSSLVPALQQQGGAGTSAAGKNKAVTATPSGQQQQQRPWGPLREKAEQLRRKLGRLMQSPHLPLPLAMVSGLMFGALTFMWRRHARSASAAEVRLRLWGGVAQGKGRSGV
jgi:hypothetical protein